MARDFTNEMMDLIAGRFKLLAEPTRLYILNALRDGERTVTALVEATGAGQANVSKHLNLLHRNGMVDRRKDGLHVYYSIADPGVFELCELMCSSLEAELEERRRVFSA
jgi:DNA-binding transcriptional ArsR family regulator